MHDNFLLRSTLGAPYEFLWANPYHPGLSYYLAPLVFHDENLGRLFIRSSWDDDAEWFGLVNGQMQLFSEGKVTLMDPQLKQQPIEIGPAMLVIAQPDRQAGSRSNPRAGSFANPIDPSGRAQRVDRRSSPIGGGLGHETCVRRYQNITNRVRARSK